MKKLSLIIFVTFAISCSKKIVPTVTVVRPVPTVTATKPVEAEKVTILNRSNSEVKFQEVADENTMNIKYGKQIYENNCASCHKLYASKDFTKTEWKPILITMQKKAHLNDNDMMKISVYIESEL